MITGSQYIKDFTAHITQDPFDQSNWIHVLHPMPVGDFENLTGAGNGARPNGLVEAIMRLDVIANASIIKSKISITANIAVGSGDILGPSIVAFDLDENDDPVETGDCYFLHCNGSSGILRKRIASAVSTITTNIGNNITLSVTPGVIYELHYQPSTGLLSVVQNDAVLATATDTTLQNAYLSPGQYGNPTNNNGRRIGLFGADFSDVATPTIDSYPTEIRSGQTGITYATSNIVSVTAISVGTLAATSISDTTGDGTHALPGLVDETVHELFGTKTVSFNAGAATVARNFLPPTGYDFVTLAEGFNDTETGAVFEFDPPAVAGDQIVKPVELGIDEQANYLGDDGAYLCWHIQASTKIARSYTTTLGDPEEDAPPVMPADTSVNIPENSTAVGTYAAVSGTGPITYSLGGPDAALYSINSTTALVTRNVGADYEAGVNTNTITIIGTNAIDSDSMTLTINITNAIESPVMPPNATYIVLVGQTAVGNPGAVSTEGVTTYTKSGAHASLVNVNADTGAFTFVSPAVEGTYTVINTATNSVGSSSQAVTIQVIPVPLDTDDENFFITAKKISTQKLTARFF